MKFKIEQGVELPDYKSNVNFGVLDALDINDSFTVGLYNRKEQRVWTNIVYRYKRIKGNENKKFSVRGRKCDDDSVELRVWRVK